jgi:predicted HTH domain antitoxin
MKRTNILLTEEQHKKLKLYAKKEGKTLGKMVRDAVDQTYKKMDSLEKRKQIALNAYKEGLISLGKLAEVLGLDPLSIRLYLKEHRIPLQQQDLEDISQDVANA